MFSYEGVKLGIGAGACASKGSELKFSRADDLAEGAFGCNWARRVAGWM